MLNRAASFFYGRVLEVASICIGIVLWEAVAQFVVKNKFLLPSFSQVLLAIPKLGGLILVDIAVSLMHFGMGLALAACIAIPVGAVIGWFRKIERFVDPLIEIIRPIPPLAWVPFAIIWFHLTHTAAGFIVFIGAVFPILINTHAGFRGTDRTLVDAAKVLGCCGSFNLMKSVAFPSAIPSVAAGVRIGMGVGWMCVVAAEMFGVSEAGLGFRLYQVFYYLHQMDNLLLYMLILGLIALFLDRVFRYYVDRRLVRWRVGLVI